MRLYNKMTLLKFLKAVLPLQRYWRVTIRRHSWFSEIIPDLFLGGALTHPEDYSWLKNEGITAVLNMTSEWNDEEDFFTRKNIEYLKIPVNDLSAPSVIQILYGVEYLKTHSKLGNKILVHCAKGRGRSATVVCAFLMYDLKIDFEDANRILKNHRSLVSIMAQQKEKLLEIQELSTFGTNRLLSDRDK